MINTNLVKAILSFYLQVRLAQWKIPTDDKLTLPTDEKSLNKIKLICKLYFNLCHHRADKDFLLAYSDQLEKFEKEERENHHSYYAPAICDYPLMSNIIRALRSHIQDTAHQHAEKPSDLQLYVGKEFLEVIKYEDKRFLGGKLQEIDSIAKFVDAYKLDKTSFSLLDRVWLLNQKLKHGGEEESYAAKTAGGTISDLMSNNKERTTNMATLFAENAERKAKKAAAKVAVMEEKKELRQAGLK